MAKHVDIVVTAIYGGTSSSTNAWAKLSTAATGGSGPIPEFPEEEWFRIATTSGGVGNVFEVLQLGVWYDNVDVFLNTSNQITEAWIPSGSGT